MSSTTGTETSLVNNANNSNVINYTISSSFWRIKAQTDPAVPAVCPTGSGLNEATGLCSTCANSSSSNCDCGTTNKCLLCNTNFLLNTFACNSSCTAGQVQFNQFGAVCSADS